MAHSIERTPPSSPGAELRADLEELEKLLVKVNDMTIERTLMLLDKAYVQMRTLRDQGVDLKAEEGLWLGFEIRLQESAGEFVRIARSRGGLDRLRRDLAQTDGLWWHIDNVYRAQIRHSLFKVMRWLGIIGGLVLTGWIMLRYVIPVDESTVQLTSIIYDVERAIDARDFVASRAIVEEGLERTDDAAELLLWGSVIAEQEGDLEKAQDYQVQAFKTDVPPVRLWITLGTNRLRAGALDSAECAALTALEMEETNAQAHFLIASIAETLGDYDKAVAYFNKTYDLAEQHQPQLAVIARVRMGNMMQSPGLLTAPTVSERELTCN